MLQKMRDNAQGTAAKILLGLLVVVFTMFGFGAFQAFIDTDPPAAEVNGEKISQATLAAETERQRIQILGQMGDAADPELIDTVQLQRAVLDRLINRQLLIGSSREMGIRISAAEVDQLIVANPQFQVEGKFNPDLYLRLLANVGHNSDTFKLDMTNNLTVVQINGAIAETPFATEVELQAIARLATQTRDFAYLIMSPENFSDAVTVSDDEIDAYYQSHLTDYLSEETVDVEYVRLSLDDTAKSEMYTPTEEEIQAQYDADKAVFAAQEQRQIAHILLSVGDERTEEQADTELSAVSQRIAAGESFADVARAISEDPGSASAGGDLGFVAQGALDPAFEQAAWALKRGEISAPVRSAFGVHLIQVLDVKTQPFSPIEEQREAITSRVRHQKADEDYRAKIRTLDEVAFESPDGLGEVAGAAGVEANHVIGVTKNAGAAPFENAQLRAAAFSDDVLLRGSNSPTIEVDDAVYVLRVSEHRPAVQRSLTDVSDQIRIALVASAAVELARQAADDVLAKVNAGEGSTTVAAAYGMEWTVAASVARNAGGYEPQVVAAAFDVPAPTETQRAATTASLGQGRIAVVTLTAVKDGSFGALTEVERDAFEEQLGRRIGGSEFNGFFETLRNDASIDRI